MCGVVSGSAVGHVPKKKCTFSPVFGTTHTFHLQRRVGGRLHLETGGWKDGDVLPVEVGG